MKHLNELEQRLEQAAHEVRQTARHAVPPPLEDRVRRRPRAWLVFATAFGAVILAVGVVPMLSRSDDPGTVGETTPTTVPSVVVTTTAGSDPATTVPVAADCSAAGLPMPAEQEGLPTAVADSRRAIAAAAIACDYETLESLADPDLNTSFGGGGFDNLQRWEEEGTYPALALLVRLFDTPYATEDYDGLPRHYYWPSAFVYDTWEEIPPADLEALRSIYTQEELDQITEFGSYALWRIGLTESGGWRFFVAGD